MKDKDSSIIDLSKLDGGDNSDESSVDDDFLKEVGVVEEEEEFKIHHLGLGDVERASDHEFSGARDSGRLEAFKDSSDVSNGPASKVKVKFDKFITLVATHTYEDVLKKNAGEDVIISTNLLTDLANAHEEEHSDKKLPLLFAVGLVLGIVITWLILRS